MSKQVDKQVDNRPWWKFCNNRPEGVMVYAGAERQAETAEDAMRGLEAMWGKTAKQGWYAVRLAENPWASS